MKKLIQESNHSLIFEPSEEDIKGYHVHIPPEMKDSQIMFFAQTIGFADDNDYQTFILFKKENKTYIFYEYDNPQHASLNREIQEFTYEEFKLEMREISNSCDIKFIESILKQECDILFEKTDKKSSTTKVQNKPKI